MRYVELARPVETTRRTYYHVTPARNLSKIMQQGLIPKIGTRARMLKEPVKAIYLFHSQSEAEDGVVNWLGDQFDETTRLALLAVHVSPDATRSKGAGFETVLTERVPPDRITIVSHDL